MLAKTLEADNKEWDLRLPFVLFAYRAARQDSTKALPFELLYGREAGVPTADLLEPEPERCLIPLDGYLQELRQRMSTA